MTNTPALKTVTRYRPAHMLPLDEPNIEHRKLDGKVYRAELAAAQLAVQKARRKESRWRRET